MERFFHKNQFNNQLLSHVAGTWRCFCVWGCWQAQRKYYQLCTLFYGISEYKWLNKAVDPLINLLIMICPNLVIISSGGTKILKNHILTGDNWGANPLTKGGGGDWHLPLMHPPPTHATRHHWSYMYIGVYSKWGTSYTTKTMKFVI